MKTFFEVICINDIDRPDEIPTSKWIKQGVIYTVVEIITPHRQPEIYGFKLKELNIDNCFPYQYFTSSRFSYIMPINRMSVLVSVDFWVDDLLDTILKEAQLEDDLDNL